MKLKLICLFFGSLLFLLGLWFSRRQGAAEKAAFAGPACYLGIVILSYPLFSIRLFARTAPPLAAMCFLLVYTAVAKLTLGPALQALLRRGEPAASRRLQSRLCLLLPFVTFLAMSPLFAFGPAA